MPGGQRGFLAAHGCGQAFGKISSKEMQAMAEDRHQGLSARIKMAARLGYGTGLPFSTGNSNYCRIFRQTNNNWGLDSMQFKRLIFLGRREYGAKNCTAMPGMGTNLAAADGTVSDVIVNYYARRANGGVGLIITEVCCPEPLGRVIPGELEITHGGFMPGLSRIPHAVHSGGAKVCLQLAHGGCFASEGVTGHRPISPSGVGTFLLPDDNPRAMTLDEIKELIEQYGLAAQRARQCGFDAGAARCAWLLPLQFLSAYTNRRTDEYGGSLEIEPVLLWRPSARLKACRRRFYPHLPPFRLRGCA